MKKIRVAFIGTEHIHLINLSHDFSRFPEDFELVGVADYPPYTKEEQEINLSLNNPNDVELPLYDDYKKLLSEDIDIAVICTDIKKHAPVCEETLAMNIHTIVEKPMAMNLDDAKRMFEAHKKSKAELIVNWPVAWFSAYNKVKELADSGEVGEVLRVQYRSPSTEGPYKVKEHDPEELLKLFWYQRERGGGSISDYAGYGFVLTTWICGKKPQSVCGFRKNFTMKFSDIEDYSAFLIDFGDCVGFLEGSWSTFSNGEIPTGPIVYGSKGVIVADRFDKKIKIYTDFIPYVPSPPANKIIEIEYSGDTIAKNMLGFLRNNEPLHEMITAGFNMRAQSAFDAGVRACNSGNTEKVLDY